MLAGSYPPANNCIIYVGVGVLRYVALLLSFVFLTIVSSPAFPYALDVPVAEVEETDTPNWVERQSYDVSLLDGLPTGGAAYHLVSHQTKQDAKALERYSRYVIQPNNIDEVEEIAQVSIRFDPTYQKLHFHHLTVTRGDAVQDRLNLSQVRVIHVEDDADELIFNGDVNASIILNDIRPSDIVDYAYTVSGKNPVFYGHINDRRRLAYGVPVGTFFSRLLVPENSPIDVKLHANAWEPDEGRVGAYKSLSWKQAPLSAVSVEDDNIPGWQYTRPLAEVTDLASWQALGALYTPFYSVPEKFSPELHGEIDRIRNQYPHLDQQVRAAIDFVQSQVRYLGIENGVGGYAPRDPSLVYARRFGDCKDKTLLLIAMLRSLGVDAKPLLVDTEERDQFQVNVPSAYAFNHVIVSFEFIGDTYWIDATSSGQFGALSTLQQANYGAGLIVDGAESFVQTKSMLPAEFTADATTMVDLETVPGQASIEIKTIYWGDRADSFLSWFERDGAEAVQTSYLDYYADSLAGLKVSKPLSVSKDYEAAKITVTEHYLVTNAWHHDPDDPGTFYVRADEVGFVLPDIQEGKRTFAYDIGTEKRVRHTLKVKNDYGSEDLTARSFDNKLFKFDVAMALYNGEITQTFIFEQKVSFVGSDDISMARKAVAQISDSIGIYDQSGGDNTNFEAIGAALSLVIFILFAWVFYRAGKRDVAWRNELDMYPVTLTKFLVMTMLTGGLYLVFWTYKNWLWFKTCRNQDIWVVMRTVFSGLTNFSLFPRISEIIKEQADLARYSPVAATIILFANIFTSIVDRMWSEAYWFVPINIALNFFMALMCVPFVKAIAATNADRSELVAKNSTYTWHSFMGVLFAVLIWAANFYE